VGLKLRACEEAQAPSKVRGQAIYVFEQDIRLLDSVVEHYNTIDDVEQWLKSNATAESVYFDEENTWMLERTQVVQDICVYIERQVRPTFQQSYNTTNVMNSMLERMKQHDRDLTDATTARNHKREEDRSKYHGVASRPVLEP